MDNDYQPTPPPGKPLNDEDRAERIDFLRSIAPKPKRRFQNRGLIAAAAIVVVVAIAAGAYLLLSANKPKPKAAAKPPSSSAAASSSVPSVPTLNYTSTDYNLSFNYPNTWKVVDSGTGPMTVTSPATQLTAANGQSVTGLITMTIQAQGHLPASFSAGPALAVLNSQLISYANPPPSQATQTYLSFVQYASTTTVGGLDAIYITGNYGYQKDGTIPATNVSSVSPLVTISFTQCGTSSCSTNLTPLTIASSEWSSKSFSSPITNMLTSLVFN